MNKSIFSAIVSLLLTALIFSMIQVAFAAYPGPDKPAHAVQYGAGGTKAESFVEGYYGGQGYYNQAKWFSSSTPLNLRATNMYVWWGIDGVTNEAWVPTEAVSSTWWGNVYDYISARCRTQFVVSGNTFFLDSGTCRADVS